MRRASWVLACFLLGCATADGNGGGEGAAGGGGGAAALPALPPATGMSIGEVSIYQGVKVTLYQAESGDVAALNAPLVAGRDALLRVFFAPKADWQPHRVAVRATFKSGQGEVPMEIQGTPGGASTEENLDSSATFKVPASMLDGSLSVRVEMLDVEAGQGDTAGSAWPGQGFKALGEQSTNGAFKLKVIPIRYDADGSGRVPDVGDERQKDIRFSFLREYPIPSIELSVGDELVWNKPVGPTGSGWQGLLQAVINLREQDPAENVYYYGLFSPNDSFSAFCGGGCVAGLTLLGSDAGDASLRTSIGLGYKMPQTLTTILHEIGHAHRRTHAPCAPGGQIDSVDPQFPYDKGKIGVWGYDLIDGSLKNPAKYSDIMSYCEPTWVSDYTFSALFNRIASLNSKASAYVLGPPTRWRQAWLDVGGELRWGAVVTRTVPPSGEALAVRVGTGPKARQLTGQYFRQSHLPGGLLMLPEDTPEAATLDAGHEGKFSIKP